MVCLLTSFTYFLRLDVSSTSRMRQILFPRVILRSLFCHCRKLSGAEEDGCRITQCKFSEHIVPSRLSKKHQGWLQWVKPAIIMLVHFRQAQGNSLQSTQRRLLGFRSSMGSPLQGSCSSCSPRLMTTGISLLLLPFILCSGKSLWSILDFCVNPSVMFRRLFSSLRFYTVSVHVNK